MTMQQLDVPYTKDLLEEAFPFAWVGYKGSSRHNKRGQVKQTKVPMNPNTGSTASVTDYRQWGSWEEAAEAQTINGWDGVGVVFTDTDDYFGIDIDDCRDPETGTITAKAQKIIDDFNTYTEVSPSGTGVHLIGKGTLTGAGRKKDQIEIYDRDRYFTVTKRRVAATPYRINDRQDQLDSLVDSLKPPAPTPKKTAKNPGSFFYRSPAITAAVMKKKQPTAFRIWEAVNVLGDGRRVRRDSLERFITQALGKSKKTRDRYIKAFEGSMFCAGEGKGYLYRRSDAKVAIALGLDDQTIQSAGRVQVPEEHLKGTTKKYKSYLHATVETWLSKPLGKGHKPVSRATIERLSGVSKTSQRRYEKTVAIGTRSNVIKQRVTPLDAMKLQDQDIFFLPRRLKDGGLEIEIPLPNSYSTGYQCQSAKYLRKRVRNAMTTDRAILLKGLERTAPLYVTHNSSYSKKNAEGMKFIQSSGGDWSIASSWLENRAITVQQMVVV